MALAADGHRVQEVADPRFFATGYASPQPFLPPLADVAWQPAQRLTPYRARRVRASVGRQEPLFELEEEEVVASAQ